MKKQELIGKYIEKTNWYFESIKLNPDNPDYQIAASEKLDIYKNVILDLNQLDEPEKPIIPQFMADYIDKNKNVDRGQFIYNTIVNSELFEQGEVSENTIPANVSRYIQYENVETFIKAVYGYEVEKEKRYRVKVDQGPNYLYVESLHLYKDVIKPLDFNHKFSAKEHALKFVNRNQAKGVAELVGGEVEEVTP